jgi:hypothetical protein
MAYSPTVKRERFLTLAEVASRAFPKVSHGEQNPIRRAQMKSGRTGSYSSLGPMGRTTKPAPRWPGSQPSRPLTSPQPPTSTDAVTPAKTPDPFAEIDRQFAGLSGAGTQPTTIYGGPVYNEYARGTNNRPVYGGRDSSGVTYFGDTALGGTVRSRPNGLIRNLPQPESAAPSALSAYGGTYSTYSGPRGGNLAALTANPLQDARRAAAARGDWRAVERSYMTPEQKRSHDAQRRLESAAYAPISGNQNITSYVNAISARNAARSQLDQQRQNAADLAKIDYQAGIDQQKTLQGQQFQIGLANYQSALDSEAKRAEQENAYRLGIGRDYAQEQARAQFREPPGLKSARYTNAAGGENVVLYRPSGQPGYYESGEGGAPSFVPLDTQIGQNGQGGQAANPTAALESSFAAAVQASMQAEDLGPIAAVLQQMPPWQAQTLIGRYASRNNLSYEDMQQLLALVGQ